MPAILIALAISGALLAQPQAIAPAASAAPNLPAYPIGANDLVAVYVYDSPELTRTIRVSEEGFVRIPMLKERIKAAGLMPSELENAIAAALTREGLIVDPFVTVTVAEYHSRPVSVMGAVKMPVTFQAAGTVTLLDALARAGGLTQEAGMEVLLSRPAVTIDGQKTTLLQRIPVKALIDTADPEVNVKLTGGEEIRVPEAGKVFVLGNVKKPGALTVRDNEATTVMKALAAAEGLLPYAGRQAYIYRREASGAKNEIPVELKRMMDRKAPDMTLQRDDILYVPDAKGARLGWAALEKALLFGGGISSALIYVGTK